ncbi:hypothetical protein [Paraburkholderia sp. GAS348]|uniref:hypothetical protein n=1 Tax=Paraburkholderia sp. GAS348 TaxID=3035132 RepID=UPI003D1A5060
MNDQTQIKLAWHYTTGERFKRICASGILVPAGAYVLPPEKPILWFSLNQYWETTANKAVTDNTSSTGIRTLSMRETAERGHGLVRFGVDPVRLLAGEALRHKAHMSHAVWRGLIEAGKRQHANPDDWRGVVEPMLIDDLAVDVMTPSFEWECVRQAA